MVIFKGMAIRPDENNAIRIVLALDLGSKLGCDVPSTYPPIHPPIHRLICQKLKEIKKIK